MLNNFCTLLAIHTAQVLLQFLEIVSVADKFKQYAHKTSEQPHCFHQNEHWSFSSFINQFSVYDNPLLSPYTYLFFSKETLQKALFQSKQH